jgi:hemoglobin
MSQSFLRLRLQRAKGIDTLLSMTPACSPHHPTDITGRSDIERLVNTFYEKVRHDDMLGFIFDDVARVDWTAHLPKMYAFWETVLFNTGGFSGNPLAAHARLVPLTAMGRPQFDRWLAIFSVTVDELFSGAKAAHIKNAAADMANVIHARINGVAQARFDPANLTPEQRARYASYKARAIATPSPGAVWNSPT